jgi:hypothetical protein
MSRILYVECDKDGRPALNEEGFGFCCETLTGLDPSEEDNWLPYVLAAERDKALAERDEARRWCAEAHAQLDRMLHNPRRDPITPRQYAREKWPGSETALFPLQPEDSD